jgi:hypothetical protein
MSSSSEPNTESPKPTLLTEPVSHDRPSPKSNPVKATSPSKFSKKSPPFSVAESTSSLSLVVCELMMLSSKSERMLHAASSSTPERSLEQSTRPTKFDTVVPVGQEPWTVELHREVGKDVAGYGLCEPSFSPTLGELISALEANPKQFPKKQGKLKSARAAHLKFKNTMYCAVFILDEAARVVLVLSLDPHDEAYLKATHRINGRPRKRR